VNLVHHNDKSNNVEFLFVDSVLVEKTFLVHLQNAFFELKRDFVDFMSNVFECELPGFALLLFEFLFFLEEILVALFLVFIHLFVFL
jgi:hypothetical protein